MFDCGVFGGRRGQVLEAVGCEDRGGRPSGGWGAKSSRSFRMVHGKEVCFMIVAEVIIGEIECV